MTAVSRAVVVGVVGGLLGGFLMNTYARAVDTATGGEEDEGAAPGARRVGRGMQPPQAEGRAEDDAAVQTGTIAYRLVTGRPPAHEDRLALGVVAHYGFAVSTAVVYALLADRLPAIRAGGGVLYGLAVWAVADEGVVPALGLSRGPRQLPPGVHAFSMVGHALYGATLEAVRHGSHRLEPGPLGTA